MAGEEVNRMNLDLNLGPVDGHSVDTRPALDPLVDNISLQDRLNVFDVNVRELRRGQRQRQRRQAGRYNAWQHVEVFAEARNFPRDVIGEGGGLQSGQGSVTGMNAEGTKICENNNGYLENEALGKKDVVAKSIGDEMSFFDCNICLDLAKDPVLTCCGHLFCWPCLHKWLNIHSQAGECPVCKGEVKVETITPIYGRGSSREEREDDLLLKIPNRPQARRVESWRQANQRPDFAIPMEEMIRRLGTRFDSSRDFNQTPQNAEDTHGAPVSSLRSRILTIRRLGRRQQSVQPQNVIDLTESSTSTSLEAGENRLASPLQRPHPVEINQERPQPVDDRDSLSSIAAVMLSESQTVDTDVAIESNASLSTSSSRRRNDPSRISDFSGESRVLRRRRRH
ncbi:hypothetical protein Leryth_019400 [Lithospermum erythrorhizon]|nr:hypothetical protein Leryth_019400 [Lithospermum erythrorhizon]